MAHGPNCRCPEGKLFGERPAVRVEAPVPAPASRPPQDVTREDLDHRFTYHAPTGRARELHDVTRLNFRSFAISMTSNLPAGREKSLAVTALEEASFWAHAAIARDPSLHDPDEGKVFTEREGA